MRRGVDSRSPVGRLIFVILSTSLNVQGTATNGMSAFDMKFFEYVG
jgi:hypothetical protein